LAAATCAGVGDGLEVVVEVVTGAGAAPPVAAVVVVGGADSVVPAEVVAVAVVVGAVAVVVEEVAVVAVCVGVEVVVDVVEATFAFPPQPARARAARMAIAVLFIAPS
jgi:hypothetical protein